MIKRHLQSDRGVSEREGAAKKEMPIRLERDSQQKASTGITKLKDQIRQMVARINKRDVVEVCSPPRTVKVADETGLAPGWSLDLAIVDDNGRPCDFSLPRMRKRARETLTPDKPLLFVGSPICTNVSRAMHMNWGEMSHVEKERRLNSAKVRL